jgi:hypothetical protein
MYAYNIVPFLSITIFSIVLSPSSPYCYSILGGLTQCREEGILREQEDWVEPVFLRYLSRGRDIPPAVYDRFMQWYFSALLVCSPNGRVGGLATLRLSQGLELEHYGFGESGGGNNSFTSVDTNDFIS